MQRGSSGNLYPDATLVGQPVVQAMPAVGVAQPVVQMMPAVGVAQPAGQPFCGLPSPPTQPVVDPATSESLAGRGFPRGLTQELVKSAQIFPIRLLVVDNSGSMQTPDGARLVDMGNRHSMVSCSRWQELSVTLASVGYMAHALGARTDFLLLNPPGGACQYLSVGGDGASAPSIPRLGPMVDDATLARSMQAVSPAGTTPLTEALQQVIGLLTPAVPELTSRGQQAVVILATDGLPNDPPSFLGALQQLQRLPVWLVVRLCTNDDNVVSYWNDLDNSLEAPLEVLDDEAGEAGEIAAKNPWLTYGPQLHLARTFGMHNRLFDLLDEAKLVPSQVREFCELLLGTGPLPEPQLDFGDFFAALTAAVNAAPSTVDPRTGRRAQWINLGRIKRLRPGFGFGSCGPGSGCVML